MNARNSLTIAEVREYLCAEHAGRVFSGEIWWSIVPGGDNNPNSFANTGDASPFWALVDECLSMGQPLGYTKGVDHLGRDTNTPHTDPELLLRSVIKPNVQLDKPNKDIITARAELQGIDPEKLYKLREAEYNAKVEADHKRIDQVIKTILAQRKVIADEHNPWENLDDDYGRVQHGGEWNIPIDRIIDFGERQMKFLAQNPKVNDTLFGAEATIWKGEIAELKKIVQKYENEGAGEGSREIDNQLLSGSGMSQGMNAGK